jgi:hypothetical protein
MEKSVFNVHYADGRTSLVMEADLDRGWNRLQKTYGFFRQSRIPYRDDLSIRAKLQLIAQPAGFEKWAANFPDLTIESGDADVSYTLHDHHLVIKVALLPHQPWRTTPQGRPEIFVAELPCASTPIFSTITTLRSFYQREGVRVYSELQSEAA